MELTGSLPYSQQPAIGAVLRQMNPVQAHHPISLRSTLILPSYLCLSHPSGLFFQVLLLKLLCTSLARLLHSLQISYSFIWSLWRNLTKSKAPYCTVFSSLLSLHPFQVQIFSPCLVLKHPVCIHSLYIYKTNKLRGLSPQANYTDRATAVCRRS
jgi:hypothetical protein